jgi:hypothetical protein
MFSWKKCRKKLPILNQNAAFIQKIQNNVVFFKENRRFFGRKSVKIAENSDRNIEPPNSNVSRPTMSWRRAQLPMFRALEIAR